jgi:ATP-dependent Clp protease ATP-binding subunit ClpA
MLSRELEETLRRAMSNAASRSHEFATLEHLLLALTDDDDAREVLTACNVDIAALLEKLNEYIEVELASIVSHSDSLDVQPTASFQRVIQRAIIHTQSSGREMATGANVLVSIFSERESHAVWFLKSLNMTRLDAVSFISHGSSNVARGNDETVESDSTEAEGKDPLSQFAVNLIAKAAAGRIDPLIGRDRELDRTIQVLCRRTKNNPLYVGDPGVGKTAIAEGLALRIYDGDVPEVLSTAVIYALDMGQLLAGTRYRGDFRGTLKSRDEGRGR